MITADSCAGVGAVCDRDSCVFGKDHGRGAGRRQLVETKLSVTVTIALRLLSFLVSEANSRTDVDKRLG